MPHDALAIYCPRCDKEMPVDRPHGGFTFAYRAWITIVFGSAACAPLFIADMISMLPLMGAVALAGPALAREANEPTRCRWCRLALESPPKGILGRRVPIDAGYRKPLDPE